LRKRIIEQAPFAVYLGVTREDVARFDAVIEELKNGTNGR